MKKVIIASLVCLSLTGCGWFERAAGTVTGGGYETCVDKVLYLQFTSGATVKYLPDGKVATCE